MNLKLSAKAVLLLSVLSVFIIPFQNCGKAQFKQVEVAANQLALASNASDISKDRDPASENLPIPECKFNGIRVPEGQSRTAFQNSKVPFQKVCMSEERTCTNGILSGTYNFSSCSSTLPASCLFNGITIKHDERVRAFQLSSVAFGESCSAVSENRICNDGKLSGSYNFSSCQEDMPAACLFDGKTVKHGESATGFQNSAVAFGEICVSETRLCVNGQLSGSFNFGSCESGKPLSCSFNGVTIAHGETAKAYVSSTVGFGKSCVSEDRICSNGALSGSNKFASCEVDRPAMCLFNGVTIAHGQTVNAFVSSTAAFGDVCKNESRLCSNGVLSGSSQFASCEVNKPAMCLFNGKTIAHGEIVFGYTSPTVPNGSLCSSEERKCSNGQLSGKNLFETCVVEAMVCPAGKVNVKNVCVQTYSLTTIPRENRNTGGAVQALGLFERCIVSSSKYDGDGIGFCDVRKDAAGLWSSVIGDEGKAAPQICSFTCSSKNTNAVPANANISVGSACKTSKGDGIRMTSGQCCSGTNHGYRMVTPPPPPPPPKNILGFQSAQSSGNGGIAGIIANMPRLQFSHNLICE